MRWLLVILTGLALLLSACGRIGSREKIAVVDWEKALEAHPQYITLQRLKERHSLLLDKRKEQEIIAKTQMSGLAKLHQLKQHSKQNFLSADFYARMTERQAEEQEKLKHLSGQLADAVDKEMAEEEKTLEEHYRLQMFNLRLKLDTIRMKPEKRKELETELQALQEARDRDRMSLAQHKIELVNQRMQSHVEGMQNRLEAYARQLQAQMRDEMKLSEEKDASVLQKAPDALRELLGTADQELDKQQQNIEMLEESMRKDTESVITKLAKERAYSVIFHKYRTNVAADDITGDVISGVKKLTIRTKAVDALSNKAGGTGAEQKNTQ